MGCGITITFAPSERPLLTGCPTSNIFNHRQNVPGAIQNLAINILDQIHAIRFKDNAVQLFFLCHGTSNTKGDSIRGARNLSILDIFRSVVTDGYLDLIMKAGIPLKRFSLQTCSSFTFSGISSLFNKYQSLECLCLVGVYFLSDEKMSDLSQYLSALVMFSLRDCSNLTETTISTLAKNCPLLQDICMYGTSLGGRGDRATDIVKNTRIKSLNLTNNPKLSDDCLAKLSSVCPSLEVLNVSYCDGITEKGIADLLKSSSKIRKLRINYCTGIKNIGNGFELSELDYLGATRSGINDDGLVAIGNRCPGLLNLNLDSCFGATTAVVKEILTNCKRLRKTNLNGCLNVSMEMVDWMVFSRRSLRTIIVSYKSLPSESQRKLFLRHGCTVIEEKVNCKWLPSSP